MSEAADDFRIRVGRLRDLGGRSGVRSKIFVAQVLQAAARAGLRDGRVQARARPCGAGFGRGRAAAIAAGLRSSSRRVVVQARIVRHRGHRTPPLFAHIAYLQRDGVDRTGSEGRMFNAAGEADGRGFATRCEGDRHHFRFMVSPEDAVQLADLRATTRDLMAQAERDLGTRLDWVAVDHWNTAHPHVHLLVRGKDETGADLVIGRDWITRGFRARAEALVSLELGPRSAREIAADLERQVSAERWTGLDRTLSAQAADGTVDLRPGSGAPEPGLRALLIGRAEHLAGLGLADREGPGVWRLAPDAEVRLREVALRGDIVRTLQRAVCERRALADLDPAGESSPVAIVGRLVARGLFDEQAGSAYVAVDGIDGRVHHMRLPDLAAAGDTPLGGIVEYRPQDADRPARLIHRSDLGIEAQILAPGATWLDRRLLAAGPAGPSEAGFGAEVGRALERRAQHLGERGLARRSGRGWTLAPGLLETLRGRELRAAGEALASVHGLRFSESREPQVRGLYRRRVDLASGRFAMVEDGLGFRLVPWARVLDRCLGQEVRGALRDGGVDWRIGPRRDLSR